MLLIDWLIERYPTAKRTTLKRMVEAGRVRINGRRARKLKEPVQASDLVRVDESNPAPAARLGVPIVYEDADLLVVDKPAGLLTSTVPGEKRRTLLAMVREYVKSTQPRAQLGLIHRLDRDASGLLVFSKSHVAYESLKTQLFTQRMGRVYWAMVESTPVPPEERIESRVVERADGSVHSVEGKGMKAVTEYQVMRSAGGRSLLRVRLHTGRKHQIRVHLSEKGTPVVGDAVYGTAGPRLMLMAAELELNHPRTGKLMHFELPLPPEWELTPPE